jgi:hypothetical protein
VNVIAFVLSLLVVSAAHAAKLEPVKVERLSAESVAVTQVTIRKGLRDPESARFGEIIGGRNAQGVLHGAVGSMPRTASGAMCRSLAS